MLPVHITRPTHVGPQHGLCMCNNLANNKINNVSQVILTTLPQDCIRNDLKSFFLGEHVPRPLYSGHWLGMPLILDPLKNPGSAPALQSLYISMVTA